jgi:hypothetical protein
MSDAQYEAGDSAEPQVAEHVMQQWPPVERDQCLGDAVGEWAQPFTPSATQDYRGKIAFNGHRYKFH